MFKSLISRIGQMLADSGIPYMIIGGQAVLLYGTPRLTKDIDITLGINVDELEKAVKVVKNIGLDIIPKSFECFVKETFVLPTRDKATGIRVDLIFSFTIYEKQAIERAAPFFFGETNVMFASVEDVIIHKIFAGRPRDLEDVASMIIKNPDFDRAYIEKWLKEFDSTMESNEFTVRFSETRRQLGLS